MATRSCILLLCLASAALFFMHLGSMDIQGRDEIRRAQVVRVMMASDDMVIPRQSENGKPYLSKPPQYYWHALFFSKIAGEVNEWTLRLPSAVAALVTVLLTFYIARLLGLNREGAFLAALLLMLSPMFIKQARMATLDMTLCMFEIAAIACFLTGIHKPDRRQFWYACLFACLALAFVTKGPIGIITPLLAIITWLALEKRWSDFFSRHSLWHIILLIAIACPWYVMIYFRLTREGQNPWDLLFHETVQVAVDSYAHKRPVYYFLYQFPASIAPWSLMFIAGLFFIKKIPIEYKKTSRFALACFLPNFILFSLFSSKQTYYLLPLYPAACLFIAPFLLATFRGELSRKAAVAIRTSIGLAAIILPIAIILFALRLAKLDIDSIRIQSWIMVNLLIMEGIVLLTLIGMKSWQEHLRISLYLLAGVLFSTAMIWFATVMPVYARNSSVQTLARQIDSHSINNTVYFFHYDIENFSYYCESKLVNLITEEEKLAWEKNSGKPYKHITLEQLLASKQDFLIMTAREKRGDLPMDQLHIIMAQPAVIHKFPPKQVYGILFLKKRKTLVE